MEVTPTQQDPDGASSVSDEFGEPLNETSAMVETTEAVTDEWSSDQEVRGSRAYTDRDEREYAAHTPWNETVDAFTRIREAGIHPVTAFMVPLGYGVFLLTATHWPSLSMNELHASDFADKFYHFFGYMGFAILTLFAVRMSEKYIGLRIRTVRLAIRGLLFMPLLMAVAIADELTQPLVDRNFSLYDLLFDFIGIGLPMAVSCGGLCFMALFERRHGESL